MEVSPYSRQFFTDRAARANNDARLMVPDVSCSLGKCPASVIDIGCGDGAMLRWWREMGAKSLIGVDQHGPDDWARAASGLHVRQDITRPIDLGVTAELVVCLEVAEHLPEEAADTLVDTLCRHGARILFSAAPPGQGGTGHLNEQPMSYWAEKFKARGYVLQDIVRHRLHGDISPWYRANTVLMCREDAAVRLPRTKVAMAGYRDSFGDVQDAVSDLTKGDLLPVVYGSPRFVRHRLSHDAEVGKMRSQIASDTIDDPSWHEFTHTLWIDDDSIFSPLQAIDLVLAAEENGWDITSGIYVTKQPEARIVHRVDGGVTRMGVGPYAQPYQVDGIGFGFCVTRNDLLFRMAQDDRAQVARTWLNEGRFIWDFFRQELGDIRAEWLDPMTGWLTRPYFSEDTSFCERAKAMGVRPWIQPQVCIRHRGKFDFGIGNLKLEGEEKRA